jgi:5-(carboxyamino)imidazole ribonucleotide mutase
MPNGVPVATVALNAAKNAGLLAAQIIGSFDAVIAQKLAANKQEMEENVMQKVDGLKAAGWPNQFDPKV